MLEVREKAAKPLLKWAGGKGRLIPQLQQFYPKTFNKYFEPFFGGGAVFFSIQPKGESHINDINDTLIDAYIHIRDNVSLIISELQEIERKYKDLGEEQRQELYYKMRSDFNEAERGIKKTVSLIFLNKTCFNGLYRENSKGHFNVPFGRYANPRICDDENLRATSQAFLNTHISSTSFEEATQKAASGDFVYFDPPYHPLNSTSSFTSYHEDGFAAKDQERLRNLFVELDKRGCYVMLSNSTAPLIEDLYKNYRKEYVYAGRSINASGNGRGKIPELVVLNY